MPYDTGMPEPDQSNTTETEPTPFEEMPEGVAVVVAAPPVHVRVGPEREGVRQLGVVTHKRVQAHTDDPPPSSAAPKEDAKE